jgi:gluconolactonase
MPRFFSTALLLCAFAGSAWSQDPGVAILPDSLMAPGTKVQWVKKMVAYCEGPTVNAQGMLFFTEQRDQSTPEWPIWKIDPANPADTGTVFLRNSSNANGMNFDTHGRLVAAQRQKVTRYESNGAATVLATSGNGADFNLANDLSIASNGTIYFTDLQSNIFLIDTAGKLKVAYSDAQGANGIELVEEQGLVYVNEGYANQVTRYHVAADGSLGSPELFVRLQGVDGLTLDEHGNFYIASYTNGLITVFNAAGQKLGTITMTATGEYDTFRGTEANTSNCAFGGPDKKTLFITGDGGVYSVRLKIAGRKTPGSQAGIIRGRGDAAMSREGLIQVTGVPGMRGTGYIRPSANGRMSGGGSGLRLTLVDPMDRSLASWPATLDPVTSVLTVDGSGNASGAAYGYRPGFTAWVLSKGAAIVGYGR